MANLSSRRHSRYFLIFDKILILLYSPWNVSKIRFFSSFKAFFFFKSDYGKWLNCCHMYSVYTEKYQYCNTTYSKYMIKVQLSEQEDKWMSVLLLNCCASSHSSQMIVVYRDIRKPCNTSARTSRKWNLTDFRHTAVVSETKLLCSWIINITFMFKHLGNCIDEEYKMNPAEIYFSQWLQWTRK
jgi:hypothetical protein